MRRVAWVGLFGVACTVVAQLAPTAETPLVSAAVAAVTVSPTVIGTTPDVLGYNIGHGMAGSNAADWWRYSGAKAARVFISPSDIEPTDDIAGTGDGVTTRASFDARRAALRANAADPNVALDPAYVAWSKFTTEYGNVATGNNRFAVTPWFTQLRSMGVEILANITASPSRFPLTGVTDYANMWELWQHYYAQAFLLSRDHAVRRFGMFNEPNNWTPAISVENWALRLRVASDAIQAGVRDMNARYGRALAPQVFAPNTANGATKYDDTLAGDYWGKQAIVERGLDLWGDPAAPGWSNLQVYNYQKYTTSAADFASDFDALRAKIAADTGGTPPPMALTEYNVRTGANYDARVETGDSPSDIAALGATSIALGERAAQLYLFKFAMTERTGTYPVAKNGTHYVDNATTGVNNYGGAAGTAEAYRLFLEASGQRRDRLAVSSTLGAAVSVQATRDVATGSTYVYLANTATTAATVDIDVAALGVADGSLVTVKEVSTTSRGGVVRSTTTTAGVVSATSMPAQSVWLVSIHDRSVLGSPVAASADTVLADGTGRTTAGTTTNPLVVRADGTQNGRRVALIKFAVPTTWTADQRVLLSMNVSTTAGTVPVQAHVYGVTDDTWAESVTFSTATGFLKQNVAAGNVIANNVVAGQGSTTRILGQVFATSTTPVETSVDVTDFVKSQTDGTVSFLVVQDHRWNTKLPELTVGDTQPAGVRIASREAGATGPRLRISAIGATPPPPPPPAPTVVAAEFESLTVAASSGDSRVTRNDAQASGGRSILFRSNAVGDFITFRLSVPTAGTYSVEVLARMASDLGIVQLAVADVVGGPYVDVDTPKDEYRPAVTFGSIGTFTARATFATSGTKFVRFRVTGRNASSTNFNVNLDKITLRS